MLIMTLFHVMFIHSLPHQYVSTQFTEFIFQVIFYTNYHIKIAQHALSTGIPSPFTTMVGTDNYTLSAVRTSVAVLRCG